MRSGKLRHVVTVSERSVTRDAIGGIVDAWVPALEDIRAEIVPLSGREFVAAQAEQAGVTTRITIRFRPGIVTEMRVEHGGDIYNIKAVLPDPTLRGHLTLMCETGVNDG